MYHKHPFFGGHGHCKRQHPHRGRFNALNPKSCHFNDVSQEAKQFSEITQESFEEIYIKDSCDVEVTTTNVQAALSLQAALQAAIKLVISISIADSSKAERLSQDLLNFAKTRQVNYQQTYIENSRDVKVTTTDAALAVNIQILVQILVALIVRLDIL